jgi:metal-dependent amidase/aminoacylase/carboxypeptidase family protein
MNTEFYETEMSNTDVLMDLFIDQLHKFAELEVEENQTTAWVSSSADRATHF